MKICWIILLTLFSLLAGGRTERIVPGGPFISLTGDAIPIFTALFAIGLALSVLRKGEPSEKALALTFILLSTISISQVIIDVYSFWFRPHSRGDLFGL